MKRYAVISPRETFRYILGRSWDIGLPSLTFVMLNPSIADAAQDDPTIRKCIGFAARLGYGGIEVTNLFAFRATDPALLRRGGYQVGPENDYWIRRAIHGGQPVVCAWGAHARGLSRQADVLGIIRRDSARPMSLALTEDGIPRHPLMLPYSCTLTEIPA